MEYWVRFVVRCWVLGCLGGGIQAFLYFERLLVVLANEPYVVATKYFTVAVARRVVLALHRGPQLLADDER